MPRSSRRDRIKLVVLSIALSVIAGWALWVTSPKPELSSVAWDSPFTAAYVEGHRGRVITEVSKSFELLGTIAAIAGREGVDQAADQVAAFLPYSSHAAVSNVRDLLRTASIQELSGIFAYTLRDSRLERALPHELPSSLELLAPHMSTIEAFAAESGFEAFFDGRRDHYDALVGGLRQQTQFERIKAWLDAQFPAVSHDAIRVIVSPTLSVSGFSHNFTGDGYSEIVLFVPATGLIDGDRTVGGRSVPQGEIFAGAARHYVNRMTDRYIRIVNRVFANVAVWRAGALTDEPSAVFNEYMSWAAYLLHVRDAETSETYRAIAEHVIDHMHALGYVRFETLWERIAKLYDDRDEPLGALYPRIVREAIGIANAAESL